MSANDDDKKKIETAADALNATLAAVEAEFSRRFTVSADVELAPGVQLGWHKDLTLKSSADPERHSLVSAALEWRIRAVDKFPALLQALEAAQCGRMRQANAALDTAKRFLAELQVPRAPTSPADEDT